MKVCAVFQARVVDRPVVVFAAVKSAVGDKPQVCGDGGSVLDKNLLCADCAVNFDLLALVIELPRLYDIGSRCRPRLHKKRLAPCRCGNDFPALPAERPRTVCVQAPVDEVEQANEL